MVKCSALFSGRKQVVGSNQSAGLGPFDGVLECCPVTVWVFSRVLLFFQRHAGWVNWRISIA